MTKYNLFNQEQNVWNLYATLIFCLISFHLPFVQVFTETTARFSDVFHFYMENYRHSDYYYSETYKHVTPDLRTWLAAWRHTPLVHWKQEMAFGVESIPIRQIKLYEGQNKSCGDKSLEMKV